MSTPSIYSRPKNEWLEWVDGSGSESSGYNVVDSSGNVYTVGSTTSTTLYVGDNVSSTSYSYGANGGGFLTKHNSSGVLQWIVRIYDASGTQTYRSIVLTNNNSFVYIAGNTVATSISVALNNGSPVTYSGGTGSSVRDIFILKINTSTGAITTNSASNPWIVWLTGATGSREPYSLSIDNLNNLNVSFTTNYTATHPTVATVSILPVLPILPILTLLPSDPGRYPSGDTGGSPAKSNVSAASSNCISPCSPCSPCSPSVTLLSNCRAISDVSSAFSSTSIITSSSSGSSLHMWGIASCIKIFSA